MRKKTEKRERRDELRREYDLSKLKGGVRGQYAARYRSGTNLILPHRTWLPISRRAIRQYGLAHFDSRREEASSPPALSEAGGQEKTNSKTSFRTLYFQLSLQRVDNANRTVNLPFSQVFRVKDRSARTPGSLQNQRVPKRNLIPRFEVQGPRTDSAVLTTTSHLE